MANISHYIGKEAGGDECKAALKGDKMKEEVYDRFAQHLENNGVDIAKSKPTLGPMLQFDPDKEVFVGDGADEANKLVKGDYRKEFSIPDTV